MNYTVKVTQSESYILENIEADSSSEAYEKALDIMEAEGKESFHNDSGGDYEIL